MGNLECLTLPDSPRELENSKKRSNREALKLWRNCQFYNIEDKLQTELKFFHTSYSFPPPVNVTSMLLVVKENNKHLVFPNMSELLKTYGTLPLSKETVEHSFSKLKLVKTKLCSLCKEKRLSGLLLWAIQKDVPINRSDVICIFWDMANRKLLLWIQLRVL